MKRIVLGKGENTAEHFLDVEKLVESRMLVSANSGGGKSWAVRRILEQTHGQIQQIVIDPEDEFYTLREKYDYILAGREGGECAVDPRSAPLLARRLLELNVSAILSLFELKPKDRVRFVRAFLDALVDAPKALWHPCLVVVDEAHSFAPEKGHGEAESLESVIGLMSKGRKRGFCGVLATQRLSKLNKDAAAEANNRLIGRCALDVDMKRASYELGFSAKDDQLSLRELEPGYFFAFGPALSKVITKVHVGDVKTSHPKIGQRAAPAPAPKAKVVKILGKLADLPKEAEEQIKDLEAARRRIAELERQERQWKIQSGTRAPEDANAIFQRAHTQGYAEGHAKGMSRADSTIRQKERIIGALQSRLDKIRHHANSEFEERQALKKSEPDTTPLFSERMRIKSPKLKTTLGNFTSVHPSTLTELKKDPEFQKLQPNGKLTGPEQRILDALAWMESIGIEEPEQTAVAFLAGYTIGGGAWNNPRGALRTKGLIEYRGDQLKLTEEGRSHAKQPDTALNTAALHEKIMERLPGPEGKILQVLIDEYPHAVTNEALAEAAGYSPGGGAYNNPRGRLRSLGLIEYTPGGCVKAKDLLFLEPQ